MGSLEGPVREGSQAPNGQMQVQSKGRQSTEKGYLTGKTRYEDLRDDSLELTYALYGSRGVKRGSKRKIRRASLRADMQWIGGKRRALESRIQRLKCKDDGLEVKTNSLRRYRSHPDRGCLTRARWHACRVTGDGGGGVPALHPTNDSMAQSSPRILLGERSYRVFTHSADFPAVSYSGAGARSVPMQTLRIGESSLGVDYGGGCRLQAGLRITPCTLAGAG